MFKKQLNGYIARIKPEMYPESPLEWEELYNIAFFHRSYDFAHGIGKDFNTPEDWRTFARENKLISVPLHMLDHSGIRFSAGDFRAYDPQGWDSGVVGFVFLTYEQIRKEWGWKRITKARKEQITAALKSFISVLDQYVSGDVWYYEIEDRRGEFVDSCGGFYGLADTKAEALESLRHYAYKAQAKVKITAIGSAYPLRNK